MSLEQQVHDAIEERGKQAAELAEGAGTEIMASILVMLGRLKGIEDALALLARRIETDPLTNDPATLTPAERAAVYRRVQAILAESGDGSE